MTFDFGTSKTPEILAVDLAKDLDLDGDDTNGLEQIREALVAVRDAEREMCARTAESDSPSAARKIRDRAAPTQGQAGVFPCHCGRCRLVEFFRRAFGQNPRGVSMAWLAVELDSRGCLVGELFYETADEIAIAGDAGYASCFDPGKTIMPGWNEIKVGCRTYVCYSTAWNIVRARRKHESTRSEGP